MAKRKVAICAYRMNKGATGGAGGVLFMLQDALGKQFRDVEFQYIFKENEGKTALARYFKTLMDCNPDIYICHDVVSAFLLSMVRKKYILIYHQQGPLIQERINLGVNIGKIKRIKTNFYERKALKSAESVHFPSDGAKKMYFSSEFRSVEENQVRIGEPMYNTIYVDSDLNESIDSYGLERDNSYTTFYSVGTLTEAKGQDRAVVFLDKYCENCSSKVRYILIGQGVLKDNLLNELEVLKKKHDNFSYVYIPRLEHKNIFSMGIISDVYLMLHRISIFDLSTLEAMYTNNAIVLSDIGGNLDFNKSENIVFCNCTDYQSAAKRLDSIGIENLKQKNKECFEKYFSRDAFKERYYKLALNGGTK